MRALIATSMLALALSLSACAKKKNVGDLPPPAAAPATANAGGIADAPVASGAVPGSQADLIATVGSDRVFFEYDSYTLSDEARSILQREAEWLRRHAGVALTIEGHSDERGTREYNLALGDRRANAVKNHLAALGIPASRLRTISYGKERPAVPGSDDQSHAQNRRAVSVVSGGPAS
jgi:peptidoglycan-associated lipoprotein